MGRCLGPPVGVICAQSPPTPTGKLGVPARCPCAPRSGGHGSGPLGGGREGGRPASSTLQLGREACQAGRLAAPERVPWGWAGAGAMPAPWCSGARPQAPPSLHLGHSQVHAGHAVSCPAPGHCPPALQTPCRGRQATEGHTVRFCTPTPRAWTTRRASVGLSVPICSGGPLPPSLRDARSVTSLPADRGLESRHGHLCCPCQSLLLSPRPQRGQRSRSVRKRRDLAVLRPGPH